MVRLLAVALALLWQILLMLGPGTQAATAASTSPCRPDQLARAKVEASLTFRHRGFDHSKVTSTLTIEVPLSWAKAQGLLLSADTETYKASMRCLLGGDSKSGWRYHTREWRRTQPRVTVERGGPVLVEYEAFTWADALTEIHGTTAVGPWELDIGERRWRVVLTPPPALARALWTTVTVDLGGPQASAIAASPKPGEAEDAAALTWHERPGHRMQWPTVDFVPPLPQRWNVASSGYPWNLADGMDALYWHCAVACLMLLAARRMFRSATTTGEFRAAWGLVQAVMLVVPLVLVGYLRDAAYLAVPRMMTDPTWHWYQAQQVWVAATVAGLGLCVFGRPRRSVGLAVTAAGALSLLVPVRPQWVSLPEMFDEAGVHVWDDADGPLWGLAGASAALVFVGMVGFTSAIQRIMMASWGRTDDPRIRLRGAGITLAAVAAVVGLWSLASAYRRWSRVTWLSSQNEDYRSLRTDEFIDVNAWFAWQWLDEQWGWAWLISAVALLFAIRAKALACLADRHAPRGVENLLVVIFFVVALVPSYGWYAGIPTAWLSLFLNVAAALCLLLYGARRSRLTREIAPGVQLSQVLTLADRSHFLRSARRHRELHAQLRRLERGQSDDGVLERLRLERALDRVHRWRISPAVPRPAAVPNRPRLPNGVGPVDVVLTWGPHATWWDNACYAARIAGYTGIPATSVMFWVWSVKDDSWAYVLEDRIGVLGSVMAALSWQVAWTAGGFLLGALWRVLPGRYGPTRALFVAGAFTAPIAAHQLAVFTTGQTAGVGALACALFLLVLTITGLVMDIQTFGHEVRYWRSRVDLLLSIYQMRHASVQAAYVLAQIALVLAIWQQIRSGEPPSLPNKGG